MTAIHMGPLLTTTTSINENVLKGHSMTRADILLSPAFQLMRPAPVSLRQPPPGVCGYGVIIAKNLRFGGFIFEPVNPLVCDYGLPMKQVYLVSTLDGICWHLSLVIGIVPFGVQLLVRSQEPDRCSHIREITHVELRINLSTRPIIQKLLPESHLQDALRLLNSMWPYMSGDTELLSRLQFVLNEITNAAMIKKSNPPMEKQEQEKLLQRVFNSIFSLQQDPSETDDAYILRAREIGRNVTSSFLKRSRNLLPPPQFQRGTLPSQRPLPSRFLSQQRIPLKAEDSRRCTLALCYRGRGWAPPSMFDLRKANSGRGGTRGGSPAPNPSPPGKFSALPPSRSNPPPYSHDLESPGSSTWPTRDSPVPSISTSPKKWQKGLMELIPPLRRVTFSI